MNYSQYQLALGQLRNMQMPDAMRAHFSDMYSNMAESYYNNEYNLIGNITESTEQHSTYTYNVLFRELVAHIATII